jgi:hypothetical protein
MILNLEMKSENFLYKIILISHTVNDKFYVSF